MKRLIGKVIREVLVNEMDERMEDLIFDSIITEELKEIYCYTLVPQCPYSDAGVESITGVNNIIGRPIIDVKYIDIRESNSKHYGQYAYHLASDIGTMEMIFTHCTIRGRKPNTNLFVAKSKPTYTTSLYSKYVRSFPILYDLIDINLARQKPRKIAQCTCPLHLHEDPPIKEKTVVNTQYRIPKINKSPWVMNNIFFFEPT